jgi:hypothetical protein
MAARRLLIVLLVLLGVSTLAAALVPQRSLDDGDTTTTTETTPTTTTPEEVETVPPVAEITVGGRKFPIVPVRAGEQFTLLVLSRRPREVAIPEYGLLGFATAETPARFELLPTSTGRFGIMFTASGKPAGQIEVTERSPKKGGKGKSKKKGKAGKPKRKGPRTRAPAGSGQA